MNNSSLARRVPINTVKDNTSAAGNGIRTFRSMMNASGTSASHVGELVSLAALGRDTLATVLSRSWSPSLGEVLRLREEHQGQPSPIILLYGEVLGLLFPAPNLAALHELSSPCT
jgi:hypothetical protein